MTFADQITEHETRISLDHVCNSLEKKKRHTLQGKDRKGYCKTEKE